MQATSQTEQRVYRFGTAEVDTLDRVLRVDGRAIHLGARAFELLLVLVENTGRLVTKSELLRLVWADTVVGDFNLHVQISTLRKHLGSHSIRTIPGRGYIFMAPSSAPKETPLGEEIARRAPARREPDSHLLFGRDEDLAELTNLIASDRLVCITGSGGVGKTQVARKLLRQLQPQLPNGVVMVDLTTLTDAAALPVAIGMVLQTPLGTQDPTSALLRAARGLEALLLLDNAEIMRDAVIQLVERMLEECPGIRFLVTSQMPLKIPSERQYRLEPLAVPPPGSAIGEALTFDALALFQHRVQLCDRRFRLTEKNLDAAIRICARLDGLPLAIELVAPRCPALGLTFVDQQLHDRFQWFRNPRGGAPDRQRTLGTVMQWSYDRLSPAQKRVFRELGICSGSFRMDFAEALLAALDENEMSSVEVIEALHEHGLISLQMADPPRFRLLETARSFALEQLELHGEYGSMSKRYILAVRALFERAYEDSWVMTEPRFLERYEPELDLLRSALESSLNDDVESAVALCGASAPLWRWLSMQHQALSYYARLSQADTRRIAPELLARFYCGIAMHYSETANLAGRELARRAIKLYEELADERGQYLAHAHLAYSYWTAEPGEASASHAALLRLENPHWPPLVRLFGARIEHYTLTETERIAEGRKTNAMRLTLASLLQSEYDINSALVNLADFALMAGDASDAITRNRGLLARLSRRQAAARAIAIGNLLESYLFIDARKEAIALCAEFNALAHQLDFMFGMFAIDGWALLAAREGMHCVAGHLLGYSDSAYTVQHRGRGVNALRVRNEAAERLRSQLPEHELSEYLAYGANLSAAQACSIVTQAFLAPQRSLGGLQSPP